MDWLKRCEQDTAETKGMMLETQVVKIEAQ